MPSGHKLGELLIFLFVCVFVWVPAEADPETRMGMQALSMESELTISRGREMLGKINSESLRPLAL